MKTIKLFDGVQVTTKDEIKKYPDMTVFDEVINCTDQQKEDIIRLLIGFGTVDLSEFTTGKARCILDLYTEKGE